MCKSRFGELRLASSCAYARRRRQLRWPGSLPHELPVGRRSRDIMAVCQVVRSSALFVLELHRPHKISCWVSAPLTNGVSHSFIYYYPKHHDALFQSN